MAYPVPETNVTLYAVGPGPVPDDITVTVQVAVCPPSLVVTVIVAVPGDTAVTLPFPSTVATDPFDDDHVTVLSVASAGDTVAVRVRVAPSVRDIELLLRVTPVTSTAEDTTKDSDAFMLPPPRG
jgi:hypothetical protein